MTEDLIMNTQNVYSINLFLPHRDNRDENQTMLQLEGSLQIVWFKDICAILEMKK